METDPANQPERDDEQIDPFLAALAAAELDDEPYTDEQRAMADAGWQDFLAGRTIPWEEVRRRLFRDAESAPGYDAE